jgi:hypothetical protein
MFLRSWLGVTIIGRAGELTKKKRFLEDVDYRMQREAMALERKRRKVPIYLV